MKRDVTVNVGGGFFGLLTIALIILQLVGLIDISWLWVLAPVWIPTVLCLMVLLLFWMLRAISNKRFERRVKKRRKERMQKKRRG